MNVRLKCDCSWIAARELLATVAPALREEKHRDFLVEALRICREMLDQYELKLWRERQRLGKPGEGEC